MPDLICYVPNNGYTDADPIYVSWLDDIYYVSDKDAHSFKLATTAGGATLVQFTETITTGYVREVDDAAGATAISGLDHLEGESVYLTADGSVVGYYTVSGGSITVPSDVYTYQVGLPYSCKIKTMRFELPNPPNTTQGKIKRINETEARYVRTKNIKLGQEYNGTEYLSSLNTDFSTKSKDVSTLTKGGFSPEGYTVIKSDEPYPMTILSTSVTIEVTQ